MKRYPNDKKARISITIPLDLYEEFKMESLMNKSFGVSGSISNIIVTYINGYKKGQIEQSTLSINNYCLEQDLKSINKAFSELKKENDKLKYELSDMYLKEFMEDGVKDELTALKLKHAELISQIEALSNLR